MRYLLLLILLCGCLPEQQASLIAKKISDSTAKYCDPIKMNTCVMKFISKKKKEYKNIIIQTEDKGMAGELACPIIAKAFSSWLVNGKLSTKCGCRNEENNVFLAEKVKNACISASPY